MSLLLRAFFIFFVLPVFWAAQHELPKSIKKCSWKDPKINQCMSKAVTAAFKVFSAGVPELGVPVLDPLHIPELNIEEGNTNRPVNLNLHFKNLKLYGVSQLVVGNYTANLKEAKLISDAYSPNLWFEGDYTSDGKVLVLPLRGNGRCNISMENMITHTVVSFKPTKKGRENYWTVLDYKVNFKPQRVTMYFGNIISSSEKGINEGLNSFLNENWQIIFEELRPAFEQAFAQIFKEMTHRVFSKVPLDKVFNMS